MTSPELERLADRGYLHREPPLAAASRYRSNQRYIVFQAVSHTLGLPPAVWRLLAKAHLERNRIEYEGIADVSSTLLTDLIDTASRLLDEVGKLPLPEAT